MPLMPKAVATPLVTTNHINVQAAPGMDEKAMARAITFELDRRERELGRRSRSLMHDAD